MALGQADRLPAVHGGGPVRILVRRAGAGPAGHRPGDRGGPLFLHRALLHLHRQCRRPHPPAHVRRDGGGDQLRDERPTAERTGLGGERGPLSHAHRGVAPAGLDLPTGRLLRLPQPPVGRVHRRPRGRATRPEVARPGDPPGGSRAGLLLLDDGGRGPGGLRPGVPHPSVRTAAIAGSRPVGSRCGTPAGTSRSGSAPARTSTRRSVPRRGSGRRRRPPRRRIGPRTPSSPPSRTNSARP